MHAHGIVHRDLSWKNIMFSEDRRDLVIMDIESQWGTWAAPEVKRTVDQDQLDNVGWSEKSDVYDIGPLIKGWVYAKVSINHVVEWPVPAPLDAIVEACMRADPAQRPSLEELRTMVSSITIA